MSSEFYGDFKRVLKLTIKVIAALIFIGVSVSVIYWVSTEIQQSSKERELLNKALPFTKTHIPWVYTRTDFGNETKLELWFFGDTDKHAIIKVDGKYSVYSTSPDIGFIRFYKKAGEACDYVSTAITDGKISSVTCDSKTYNDGPWNVVK